MDIEHNTACAHSQSRDRVSDMVIEMFALSELELRERVVSLEADLRTYHEVAHMAIHALAALTLERTRLREQHRLLRDEWLSLRERREAA